MGSHVRAHSGCCAVVVTLLSPVASVGRLRVAVLESCVLCVDSEGVLVEVLFVSWLVSSR